MQNKQVTNKQIITALLIGDGTLQWRPQSSHYRIATISSKVYYEDYHMWKHQLLVSVFGDKVRICEDKRAKPLLHSWYSNKSKVEPYYKFLYKNVNGVNKKQIKPFLQRLNHPMCLAIWFMDDGCCAIKKSKRKDGSCKLSFNLELCTHQFDFNDHEYMVAWFKREFNLTPRIYKQTYRYKGYDESRDQYRLCFSTQESIILYKLLREYIEPLKSMRHKFRVAYYLVTLEGDPLNTEFEID